MSMSLYHIDRELENLIDDETGEEEKAICDDCGAEFEDPAMCTYKHYPGGEFGKEMTEYQCPYCGSEYVGKAEE